MSIALLRRVPESTGLVRIKEVLETVDWAMTPAGDEDMFPTGYDLDDDEVEDGRRGFELEANEMQQEMLSMKTAINNAKDDEEGDEEEALQVEQLSQLMIRMQTVRGKDIPSLRRTYLN